MLLLNNKKLDSLKKVKSKSHHPGALKGKSPFKKKLIKKIWIIWIRKEWISENNSMILYNKMRKYLFRYILEFELLFNMEGSYNETH